jgi:hypothetical protein
VHTVSVVVHEKIPGETVTVYEVIGLVPVKSGGDQLIVADVSPAVAATLIGEDGAVGAVEGVTEFEGEDTGPMPDELLATTAKEYMVPFVRPLTVMLVVFEEKTM